MICLASETLSSYYGLYLMLFEYFSLYLRKVEIAFKGKFQIDIAVMFTVHCLVIHL